MGKKIWYHVIYELKLSTEELMLLNCGVGEDSWKSLGQQGNWISHPKGNQSWTFIGRTDAEDETPTLWPLDAKNWLIWKDPDAWKDWRWEEKGMTKDELVGWHHWLDGHEFEEALGVGDRQENLVCCSPWSHRVSHNWATELNIILICLQMPNLKKVHHLLWLPWNLM